MATKTQKANETTQEFPVCQTKFEAYVGNEPYLFISYSHRDTQKVYPILDALYDRKYRIWYDESCETGNDFRDELRTRIENCEAVVLFVSEASMLSPFCGMEIIVARENGKRLYPIYLDDAAVPPSFQILLSNTHHSTTENMEKLIKNMVRDLPAVAMDRLTIEETTLKKCEDNGKSISVDYGITDICDEAFKNRRALHKIELPQTLERIGTECFRGCSNL
ncbi:MAG: TIR domain-containing protein, partial [Clostridia bacterium]|nr:TIR domain-containing protein [Clostridia bacterium]